MIPTLHLDKILKNRTGIILRHDYSLVNQDVVKAIHETKKKHDCQHSISSGQNRPISHYGFKQLK